MCRVTVNKLRDLLINVPVLVGVYCIPGTGFTDYYKFLTQFVMTIASPSTICLGRGVVVLS